MFRHQFRWIHSFFKPETKTVLDHEVSWNVSSGLTNASIDTEDLLIKPEFDICRIICDSEPKTLQDFRSVGSAIFYFRLVYKSNFTPHF